MPPTSPPPLDFSHLDEILIDDNWTGYAPGCFYKAHYALKRQLGQFTGEARFSVGVLHNSAPLSVPIRAVQAFTRKLAQSLLETGEYVPLFDHTDDYPKIEISLKVGWQEVANFYSASQGEYHIPWKATVDGCSYIVFSDHPALALRRLKKCLHPDVYAALVDRV